MAMRPTVFTTAIPIEEHDDGANRCNGVHEQQCANHAHFPPRPAVQPQPVASRLLLQPLAGRPKAAGCRLVALKRVRPRTGSPTRATFLQAPRAVALSIVTSSND